MKNLFKYFIKKKSLLELRFDYIIISRLSNWQLRYNLEALIADTWQYWNEFCKNLLISSCQGSLGRNGNRYLARTNKLNSVERIAYEYKQFKNGNKKNISQIEKILDPTKYPTWGDYTSLLNVVNQLGTNNKKYLSIAFSLPLQGIKELQNLRNTIFHRNSVRIFDIKNYYYRKYSLNIDHPSFVPLKMINNKFFFLSWLDDMQHVAFMATQ